MAYRTYEAIDFPAQAKAERPRNDLDGCYGIRNVIIPSLIGWLVLGFMFWVGWNILP